MLDGAELRTLSSWCHHRALCWRPASGEDGLAAMLLEPKQRRRAWERMILVLRDDGFSLSNELGEALATASDLLALLDALDGGIAETAPDELSPRSGPRRRGETAELAFVV
ncbi:MAG: hypothetical protein JO209_07600 [Acidisphaera sp.]|nr:hypothetical protein [Acidisphaera sp.]